MPGFFGRRSSERRKEGVDCPHKCSMCLGEFRRNWLEYKPFSRVVPVAEDAPMTQICTSLSGTKFQPKWPDGWGRKTRSRANTDKLNVRPPEFVTANYQEIRARFKMIKL